jgi:hypothetical protein
VQAQLVATIRRHGQADEPAPVLGHEVDGLRGDELGGHGQVPFILPTFVIAHDDHAPGTDLIEGFLDGGKR